MNRWTPAAAATVLACVPIALEHASSPALLQDSDTQVLLRAIVQRNSPFSWFTGDWPLQNHFYRPVSTLTFEMDRALYGSNAAGYGWTNDILCILCVLLLFWFVRELTDRPLFAGAAAILFASWHLPLILLWGPALGVGMWLVLAGGLWRHGKSLQTYVPAALALPFLAVELTGKESLAARMIDWLPGRTASVMSVFGLIALAAYARYERLGAQRRPEPEPTPLTPPATRNTRIENRKPSRWKGIWIVVAAAGLALAMGSYEQGIMIAPALSGLALVLWLLGYRVRWAWQALFWALLGGYFLLRHHFVPSAPSGYQLQQFRHGPGVFLDLAQYIFPPAGAIPNVIQAWDPSLGVVGLIIGGTITGFLVSTAEAVSAVWVARRHWVLAFAGWALSWGIFCPMAWLKHFDHYDYLPMGMRTIFAIALAWSVGEAVSTALRPRALQAPPRSVPAPGSLPHP